MDRLRDKSQWIGTGIFAGLIWLLAFQSPLESVWDPFSYMDEFVALIGVFLCAYDVVIARKFKINRTMLSFAIPVCIFVAVGFAGNILYQYQPWKSVMIDLYTNLKFFFAILTGYYLFQKTSWESLKKQACLHGQIITAFIFVVFLADRVFHIWPAGIRYGIMSAQLFYYHPTYLAGAMAFLVVLLTAFYEKRNLPFIAMALIMMFFTMRSKAIACAVAYVILFLFFAIWKLNIKWWQIAVLGTMAVMIAWPQISFYFIQLAGHSARSLFLLTSLMIMKDYFPIGTGFGTYGSAEAAKHYSPVYLKYHFDLFWEVRDVTDIENSLKLIPRNDYLTQMYNNDPEFVHSPPFLHDHFWPIIFGQTGFLGTAAFLVSLGMVISRCLKLRQYSIHAYVAALYVFVYLLISSVAEPAFHNAIAIPLAFIIGILLKKNEEPPKEAI